MAQTTIVSSLSATGTYPITNPVTADNNCGMLCLSLSGTWTEQMLHELPSINVKLFIDSTTVYSSFEINMRTIAEYTKSNPTEPYVLPIYDIPSSFIFSITPMFDKNALDSHNACVETGNVEMFTTSSKGIVDSDTIDPSNYWTVPTSTFDISISFDDSNVKAGGGSGGGGTSDYSQLSNKPKINNVELSDNKTSSDLGVQSTLTFDNAPTQGSNNPVTSDGIYSVVGNINSVLEGVL